ncbi:DUF2157 domain-containing protein [Chitinophaga sp. Cy-1792]|uniref:DUF2157 domain-containing protein n=1 Tax=Chitinophaga sp. Cy-1792 TaxID=2608339 RepID=UPI00141D7C2B|nr:DUF2157 domain-containing protein [Chitinophaga sp. Cy-1792]NIG57396.1 hypothetical protein [Chitinophaga sp. Cy-1792]
MLAYSKSDLDNKAIATSARSMAKAGLITPEEAKAIKEKYPVKLQSSGWLEYIGLFLITLIPVFMGAGVIAGLSDHIDSISGPAAFYGLLLIGALEIVIQQRKFYRTGVDGALCFSAILAFAIAGIFLKVHTLGWVGKSAVIGLGFLFLTLRYGYTITAAAAFLSFESMLMGIFENIHVPFLPLILMAVISFLLFRLFRNLAKKEELRYYKDVLLTMEFVALICSYAILNPFVPVMLFVAQNDISVSDSGLAGMISHTQFWSLLCACIIINVAIIAIGIRKKDSLLIRLGMVVTAASIFSIYAYTNFLPGPWWSVILGIILIAAAWGLLRYFRTPREGFTDALPTDPSMFDKLKVESLVVGGMHAPGPGTQSNNMDFGGGTGGGGGASGTY